MDNEQDQLNWLHERTQKTKSDLSTHEAVCAERYKQILDTISRMEANIEKNATAISDLHKIASEGKTSFKTILLLGGIVTGIATLVYTVLEILK